MSMWRSESEPESMKVMRGSMRKRRSSSGQRWLGRGGRRDNSGQRRAVGLLMVRGGRGGGAGQGPLDAEADEEAGGADVAEVEPAGGADPASGIGWVGGDEGDDSAVGDANNVGLVHGRGAAEAGGDSGGFFFSWPCGDMCVVREAFVSSQNRKSCV